MNHKDPGQGTIFQRKDGRWQAGLQVNGVRKTVYGKTESEVKRKLGELRRQATVAGALPDAGKRTVNDLLDHWLKTSAPNWKPRTMEDRQSICTTHIRPALGNDRLNKFKPVQVQALYADLQSQGKFRTAQKVHVILHRACRLAVLWGWLVRNPCEQVVRPQYHSSRKNVWQLDELNVFLSGAKGHWLYPLWLLAIASGARLGELLALTWDDVEWQAGAVTIRRSLQRVDSKWVTQAPKTRSSQRTLALPPQAMGALRSQKAQQAAWRLRAGAAWADAQALVFTGETGQPLHRSVVAHALKRTCQRLGILEVSPHGLRHLHTSLLLDAGLGVPAVSARLGHANPGITMEVYAHTVRRRDDAAATAMAGIMRASS